MLIDVKNSGTVAKQTPAGILIGVWPLMPGKRKLKVGHKHLNGSHMSDNRALRMFDGIPMY